MATALNKSSIHSQEESHNAKELLRVHRVVTGRIIRPSLSPLETQLGNLRRRRMALSAEIGARENHAAISVGQGLYHKKKRLDSVKKRPYLHRVPNFSIAEKSDAGDASLINSEIDKQRLAHRMSLVRSKRKIAAAFRLAGISVFPCTDDVVAIRFDICIRGSYVNSFHAFFDLVNVDEPVVAHKMVDSDSDYSKNHRGSQLYLRLSQHTLPSSVPLGSILEETLGGVAHVGPTDNDATWQTNKLLEQLRQCAQKLYHACYCFSDRQNTARIVKGLQECKDGIDDTRKYVTEAVHHSDSYERIGFRIKLLSGACTLSVDLVYKDHARVLPTHVVTKNLTSYRGESSRRRLQHSWPSISDDSDDTAPEPMDELVETSSNAFRMHPVEHALIEVVDTMLAW